jgi:hypothetical protein
MMNEFPSHIKTLIEDNSSEQEDVDKDQQGKSYIK